ncbi:hypothetical protein VB774_11255 [Pseudanabaena galeata UHCC 0370]|uniref:Uncharacterized protein n=1 Tax=Pseudanabaena galeata UHCC 0370 TaxID=3110310 RepID=A0ABU5TIQ0_9CYAN|nr:hypothetical protein [Pseudanabaena galeata]MEA5478193.1 hypothetical protein [Pseudanabaena galeata UHCC 0370]
MTTTTAQTKEQSDRENLYAALIDKLFQCPSGGEPEVLDAHSDLLDEGLVKMLVKVATYYAHHDNQDAAKFLIHVARELAKQLGLQPN